MTEIFTSIFDNYKSKIRNPFFGTIATVWLIRNWKVVYAIFNFDKNFDMQKKINYINNYFTKIDFWSEFYINIKIAFATLLITFLLLAISRFFTDLYFKVVEPRIIVLVDKKRVFTQIEKTRLENRILSLNRKLESKDNEIEKGDISNNRLLEEKADLKKELDQTSTNFYNEKAALDLKIEEIKIILKPLKSIYNDFDEIIKRFSRSELNYYNSISEKDAFFSMKNINLTYILLKEKLIADENNKIVLLNNSYNTDELLNSNYYFTSYGKLFLGYTKANLHLIELNK